MAKKLWDVYFDVRYYNGCVLVAADTKEEAREIVQNMDMKEILEHTNDVDVHIEKTKYAGEDDAAGG